MIPATIGSVHDDPELLGLIVSEKARRAFEHDHKLVVWIDEDAVCCSVDATYRAAEVMQRHPERIVAVYAEHTYAYPSPKATRRKYERRMHFMIDDRDVQADLRAAFAGLLSAA